MNNRLATENKNSVVIFYNFSDGLLKNGQRIYNIFTLTVMVNKEIVYE